MFLRCPYTIIITGAFMANHLRLSTVARISKFLSVALLCLSTSLVYSATAKEDQLQALQAALPGKLINDPTRLDWNVSGEGAGKKGVNANSPGGKALQVTIPRAGKTVYDISATVPLTAGITKGSKVVIAFWARALSADTPDGEGKVNVRFQESAAPYSGFGDTTVDIGKEWQLHEVAVTADKDIAKEFAMISLQLSAVKQVLEFGQAIVVDGATSILPKTAPAQVELLPQLQVQGTLISDVALSSWKVFGASESHKEVPAKGMPSSTAMQVSVSAVGAKPYDVVLSVPIIAAIKSGDAINVAVLARVVSTESPDGMGKLGVRVQMDADTYPGFGDRMIDIAPAWRLYQIKTHSTLDIEAGKGSVTLQLAAAKQTVEVDRVYVLVAGAN